ncbi:AraC-like DNA-binding protein [Actinocorallia herbida]|uniref:AraC-like DNA-binding protein n=1 Tax=Actinocorallia herbida TaxID=58109 RepID=A0A3N1CXI8_9ACTN|nr:AraC family transcriptional regulator [Actinocorallia herbida]ROO86019.1 AraC-like DNA-binding protein [Actinocorallia herbida]
MDVLSDVITVMRTGAPSSARVERHAPWGERFRHGPGTAGFEIVLAGSCWLIPREGDPIALGPGDALLLPHGGEYGMADAPTAFADLPLVGEGESVPERPAATRSPSAVLLCGSYELAADRGHPLLDDLPGIVRLPARPGHRSCLHAAVDLLGAELRDPGPGSDAVVPSLLDTLLVYILRTWLAEQPVCRETSGWAAALADPAVGAALNAVHADPAHPWTVAEMATRAGLSRAAFARRFTALAGRPPLAYLTWWRLTTAARLLRESDAPLAAIAAHVGYTSEYAFANAFKRTFTTAPGRYRRATIDGTRRDSSAVR